MKRVQFWSGKVQVSLTDARQHLYPSELGHAWGLAGRLWSGRRDSNPPRPAWEAGILPLNYSRSNRKGKQIFWADIITICRLRHRVKLKVYGAALAPAG